MTITATEAYDAMRAHHKALSEELSGRADAVSRAAAASLPHGAAVAAVVAYLAAEVLPHAAAEEKTIYPVAAARISLAGLIGEMVAEHVVLSTAAGRLATAASAAAAAEQAQQIAALFAVHAAKENDMLLPTLVADQSVDLPGLLGQMHKHGDAGPDECHDRAPAASRAHNAQAGKADNVQAEVLSLLLQAAAALARAGFVLVNDHAPKPLRYQFEVQYPGEHTWEYLESGPRVWRVRIGRVA